MNNHELIDRLLDVSRSLESLATHLREFEAATLAHAHPADPPDTDDSEPCDAVTYEILDEIPDEASDEVSDETSDEISTGGTRANTAPRNMLPANPLAALMSNMMSNFKPDMLPNLPNLSNLSNLSNLTAGANPLQMLNSLGLGGRLPQSLAELHDDPQLLQMLARTANDPRLLGLLSNITGTDPQRLAEMLQSLQPEGRKQPSDRTQPEGREQPASNSSNAQETDNISPTAAQSSAAAADIMRTTPPASTPNIFSMFPTGAGFRPQMNSHLPTNTPNEVPNPAGSHLDALLSEWRWQPYARVWN